jgi:hypothetical protein
VGGMASAKHREHTWEQGGAMARNSRSDDDSPADTAPTHVLQDCLLTSPSTPSCERILPLPRDSLRNGFDQNVRSDIFALMKCQI